MIALAFSVRTGRDPSLVFVTISIPIFCILLKKSSTAEADFGPYPSGPVHFERERGTRSILLISSIDFNWAISLFRNCRLSTRTRALAEVEVEVVLSEG